MKKYNPKNERLKQDYYGFLKHAKGRADSTIDGIRKAILRYEQYTGFKDFSSFNREQAMGFVRHLSKQKTEKTGKPLSLATQLATLNALRDLFLWLAVQEGFKRKIKIIDIEYLNLTEKEQRAAKAPDIKKFPSLGNLRKALFAMPYTTVIERRNRALFALTILTGTRVSALISLHLKHVHLDLDPILIGQLPDQVNTKFSKSIFSYLLPIGEDISAVFLDWVTELREKMGYSDEDPVFPKTCLGHDDNQGFVASGLKPECWSTTTPVREIFSEAFERVGLPYYNPHSFRHTLMHMFAERPLTPIQLKAFSQNLGHENVYTTLNSYCPVDPHMQGKVLKGINLTDKPCENLDIKRQLLEIAESL